MKARQIQRMFGSIAGRYDFLNHLLSGSVDRLWRSRTVREVCRRLNAADPRILDVGCGTADLSLAFARVGEVVGCDFCHPMLLVGKRKVSSAGKRHRVELLEGDALSLPFRDRSFDAAVSAFVLRNLASVEKGLLEMHRVIRPGGVLGILEFAMPRTPLLGPVYRVYFAHILPRIGSWFSGVEGPYSYLPESVRTFPSPDEIGKLIEAAGFDSTEYLRLTGGIAVLHMACRRR